MKTHVGFTGTQRGMTNEQAAVVGRKLVELEKAGFGFARHGDCIGADVDFHRLVRGLGDGWEVWGHPPLNYKKRAYCSFDREFRPKEYLVRNRDIVAGSELLIACSRGMEEELRSGTWSTVRYARKLSVPVFGVYPDGSLFD